jgi:hypothetical protein
MTKTGPWDFNDTWPEPISRCWRPSIKRVAIRSAPHISDADDVSSMLEPPIAETAKAAGQNGSGSSRDLRENDEHDQYDSRRRTGAQLWAERRISIRPRNLNMSTAPGSLAELISIAR